MVAKPKANEVHEEMESEVKPFFNAVHKVLLASIGGVVLAQEEIEDFVGKLVERGEIAEKDAREMLRDVMQKRKKDAKKAEEDLDRRMSELVDRLKIPTKSDIDHLSAQIDRLSQKVDDLSKTS